MHITLQSEKQKMLDRAYHTKSLMNKIRRRKEDQVKSPFGKQVMRSKLRGRSLWLMTMVMGFMFSYLPGFIAAQNSTAFTIYCSQTHQDINITTEAEWEQQRWQITNGMESAMGPLPERSLHSSPVCRMRDTTVFDSYLRISLELLAATDEWVSAYLYLPKRKGIDGKLPGMIALHPTGALGKKIVDGQGNINRGYGKELAERGYVVMAPDYPSFGDLEGYDFSGDRYQSATMAAIFYHMRCLDYLSHRSDVDPSRLGAIGHSLGGHNAMFLGVFDTRLQVIVASCGWTQMEYYDVGAAAVEKYGGRLGPWAQDRYMPLLRDRFELKADQFPFNFHEIIAMLAPRYFFTNSPLNDSNFDIEGVKEGLAKAIPVFQSMGASTHLQARHPHAGHDFPTDVRLESYMFIDQVLNHIPNKHDLE